MNRREILQRARLVIVGELACSPDRVTERADFRTDLKADSLDLVSIPAALEQEFDIILTDDEVAFCETVGTAIDVIEAKLENRR